jgi:hypothetical protein
MNSFSPTPQPLFITHKNKSLINIIILITFIIISCIMISCICFAKDIQQHISRRRIAQCEVPQMAIIINIEIPNTTTEMPTATIITPQTIINL